MERQFCKACARRVRVRDVGPQENAAVAGPVRDGWPEATSEAPACETAAEDPLPGASVLTLFELSSTFVSLGESGSRSGAARRVSRETLRVVTESNSMPSTTQRRVDELRRQLRELEIAPVGGAKVAAFRSLFDELVSTIERTSPPHLAEASPEENVWIDAERTVHFGRFIAFGEEGRDAWDRSPLWVSDEVGRIAGGLPTSELTTLGAFEDRVVLPEDRLRFSETIADALREPTTFDLRFRLAKSDQGQRLARLHGASSRSPHDHRMRIQAILIDATELETGFRARATLDAVFDSTIDAIVVTSIRGRILRWNPAAERFFPSLASSDGPTDVSALRLFAMEREDDRRLQDVITAAASGRFVELARWRVGDSGGEGEERIASISISPVRDRDGTITAVTMVARDETAEHLAQKELRSRDARWLELIRAAPDAIIFLDDRDRIVSFNPAAQVMFGYTDGEVVGRELLDFEAQDARPWASSSEFWPGSVRESMARHRSGRPFPVEVSLCILRSEDPVRKVVFLRDISVRRRLECELVEKERLAAVGMAASMFAHEVGNPLNNMYLHLQMLERQVEDEGVRAQLGQRVDGVMAEVCRLNALLEEFRSWHRKERVVLRPTNLRDVLEHVIRFHESDISRQGIQLRAELPRELPWVLGNEDKLKQVFHNLVKNSCEAMPGGGLLSIGVWCTEESVSIDFADTGPGIAPDLDVFEPFRTTKEFGTGLGLPIARQIIEAHGGSLSHLDGPKGGTIFRVLLPRPHEREAEAFEPGEVSAQRS